MGLFDIFKGGFKKHAGRVANKRAQNQDRWDSIQQLGEMKTAESVEALLQRFKFRMDPSIIDQEEKDAAYQGIIGSGSVAIDPVRSFLMRADSVSWPLKILEALLPAEEVVGALLELLGTMDIEYERDPEKKIQVVAYLEDHVDDRIIDAVTAFFEDMDETVRFHAVGAVWAQQDPTAARAALLKMLLAEESVRIRARILDGFIEREWAFDEDVREDVRKQLPDRYALDSDGRARK